VSPKPHERYGTLLSEQKLGFCTVYRPSLGLRVIKVIMFIAPKATSWLLSQNSWG